MRLTDLLQLIDGLNLNTKFYLKHDDKLLKWGKLTIAEGKCLLLPGQTAMTKQKLIKLVGRMRGRGIPLLMVIDQKEYSIFGLQIREDTGQAILM